MLPRSREPARPVLEGDRNQAFLKGGSRIHFSDLRLVATQLSHAKGHFESFTTSKLKDPILSIHDEIP